jgi:colanic acid biosynthesis glycosyl transferase WcaI
MTDKIKENVTLITGYYYPEDTAIGLYNAQMVEYLEKKGYKVSVITGFPNYPQWKIREDYKCKNTFLTEKIGNTKVFRYKQYVPSTPTFFKRIVLAIDFTLGSIINIFKIKKTDTIICIVPHTTTLVLGWLLRIRTKAKIWNHIQDFEFDAAKQTGISSSNNVFRKVIFGILFRVEAKLLNKANINSTISQSMLQKLEGKSKAESFYFPNWIDKDKISPNNCSTHRYLKSNAFKILYSGNIGDKQDWSYFLKVVENIDNENIEFIIVGDGAKKDWLLEKIILKKNIQYYSPVDYSELSDLLCSADLHILFQKHDVIDSVMPSKLLGMMASEKPSLIVGNSNSEVKTVIDESGGGYYLTNNDINNCVSSIEYLMNNPDKSKQMGLRARNYVVSKFSKQNVLSSFEAKLSKVLNE